MYLYPARSVCGYDDGAEVNWVAGDVVKVKGSGEEPTSLKATGGLVSNLPYPWVNKTKQRIQ